MPVEPLPDITERALARNGQLPVEDAELVPADAPFEPKPVRVNCKSCEKRATMPDGMCAQHSELRHSTAELKRRSKRLLERGAVRYAKLHMKAAEVAAREGDSKPAMEGLVWSGVVEPIAGKGGGGSGPGPIQVVIGVKLPGL